MFPLTARRAAPCLLLACSLLVGAPPARAQDGSNAPPTSVTFLPHPDDSRWWLSGQINLIEQGHGTFTSPYEGPHSLQPIAEGALSRVFTLYTGVALSDRTELIFDVESVGGRGVSDALGLAGFTNLDVVRNPDLGAAPYVARAMIRHVIPLGGAVAAVQRGPLGVASSEPARRLEIYAGTSVGRLLRCERVRQRQPPPVPQLDGRHTTAPMTTRPTRAATPTPPSSS